MRRLKCIQEETKKIYFFFVGLTAPKKDRLLPVVRAMDEMPASCTLGRESGIADS
jgi:hypothetical protein